MTTPGRVLPGHQARAAWARLLGFTDHEAGTFLEIVRSYADEHRVTAVEALRALRGVQ